MLRNIGIVMKDVRLKGFEKLTNVDEAREIVLNKVKELDSEKAKIEEAVGRVLYRDIVATRDMPPFDRAAMDGYAVRAEDTFGASQTNPIYLRVIGEASIGNVSEISVGEKEAVKIMTGTPMPRGANAVVMFEHVNELGDEIEVLKPVTPGKNVSLRGEDFKKGDTILKKGRVLKPQDIAVLASLGYREVEVYRRPKVGVISTGDELINPGESLKEGKIYDVNGYSLVVLSKMNGALAERIGIVRDNYDDIKNTIKNAVKRYDVVIVSGATSVGKRDYIPLIAKELGEILFHGVAMRPGEPTGCAVIDGKILFMLPGYPVASIVAFENFVKPTIQKMQGYICDDYPRVKLKLKRKIAGSLGRRDFVRVRITKDGMVEPIRVSGSGIITSLVKADGIVIVPENREGFEEGDEVEVRLFERCFDKIIKS